MKNSKGSLVYPDNAEWQASYPPFDPVYAKYGLKDNQKVGKTCRELQRLEFWSHCAEDFNQFLNEVKKNFKPSEHKFTANGKDIDWSNHMECLYITKNSGLIPAYFGAWFAYVKKHRPPKRKGAAHAVKKNYDSKIGVALAKFIEDKIHARNPGVTGASKTGGLFKNSDGKQCKHNYSSANGMKLLRNDFIAVINNSMSWTGTGDEIKF